MRKLIFLLFFLLLSTCFQSIKAAYEIKLSEELFVSKIDEKVFVVTHYYPWPSNSLIIKSGDEVILIDTPYENKATNQILEWIKKEINPTKITAINTGFHIDNLGGNQTLRENSIDIYGADLTIKLVKERSEKTRNELLGWLQNPNQEKYYKTYEKLKFVEPNKVFKIKKGLTLKKQGLTFEVFYPGESHSPDNVTVYIKELDILFGGCMIKCLKDKSLGFTGDANIKEWPESVKKVKNKYNKAKIVIPHHGFWGDLTLIDHTIDLFNK